MNRKPRKGCVINTKHSGYEKASKYIGYNQYKNLYIEYITNKLDILGACLYRACMLCSSIKKDQYTFPRIYPDIKT